MKIEHWKICDVTPYAGNPRLNDDAVDAVAASLKEFGFRQPIVLDGNGVIICGHTRYKAALKLGLEKVPVHVAKDLTPEQIKAYRIADNQTASLATWNYDLLPIELNSALQTDIDSELRELLQALLPENRYELRQLETKPPCRMTWVLIGIPTVRYGEIAAQVETLAQLPGIVCETTSNDDYQQKNRQQ
jgi:ParB-like chromosome segregation protein Spo0J